MNRWVTAILTFGFFATALPSQAAETLADNLSNTRNGGQSINDASWPAQAFTTTATGYVIDSIVLNLSRDAGAAGTIELYIYDSLGTGGRPGSALTGAIASLNIATQLDGTPTDKSFTNLGIALSATPATYYLVVHGVGVTGGDGLWSYTNNTTGTGFPSNYTESNDSGSTWDVPVQTSPQKMSITAVPEPSSFVFAALGGIAFHLVRRKRVA